MNIDRPAEYDREVLELRPNLYAFACSLCRNVARAEDLTQTVILKALAKWSMFEPGTNLKAWLFTMMRNQFLQDRRKAGREVEDIDGVFAGSVTVNGGQAEAYDLKVILKRMRLLNGLQRRAVQLVAIERYSYEEAAAILRTEVGTVKSSVSRARDFLESGDEVALAEVVIDPTPRGAADIVEDLFKQGLSVSVIQARIAGVSRSDVMRIIVERRLRR